MIDTGVYQIRNSINGKRYIGSVAGQSFDQRWDKHRNLLTHRKHHSPKLQAAWNKYGAHAFVFEVVLYCDPKDCIMYEQMVMDRYQPEYNICKVAGSRLSAKHSSKTRRKISMALAGNQNHLGHKHSNKTKERMSIAHRANRSNTTLSLAKVEKIRALILSGISQAKIAHRFKVHQSTISRVVNRLTW